MQNTLNESPRIGCIGCGNMGGALVRGIAGSGLASSITVMDVRPEASAELAAACGASAVSSIGDLAAGSDIVILAVKPGQIDTLLDANASRALKDRLVVSVAAGVTLDRLSTRLPASRLIRVMPNTPALIGAGVIAWTAGSTVTEQEVLLFETVFRTAGKLFRFDEKQMDAVTGLSGSGPAYVFLLLNAFAEGGAREGLNKTDALVMAAQTFLGAARMVLEGGEHPEVLKDRVTSPGGTTAAGLATLEECAVRSACIKAVHAATLRSRELGGS
ncbi:MAG TPA: pyrroline-5-carboxylate reductase [Spirochaetota bacterium]|nr:pyrroline-5-carboxylate reductase [Spirochaetota bacterium]HPH02006.1 pyrroline-5-carboxylate reductase [Spirochaetota bacterium]HPN83063.1 pyrroline-5-carboxylate reductase [Spirochaetota bacterium]